jgi:23S rRNA pseudouridine1911/1915/1917 synthase
MKTGDFEKKYSTVLVGSPKESRATLTDYMKKNPINNMVYVCPPTVEGAKFAELEYRVIEEKGGLSFTEVTLHTGRSHQIRVQMSHTGTPVYGDMRYGGEKAKKGYLSLWAYYLSFIHPVSKEKMVFRVQPPKDRNPWQKFDTDRAVTIIKPNM